MGDLRPNNGGGTPPDDGGGARPGDLPDFPPEWGTIVIPDDASELDEDAAALRRELRHRSRRARLRTIVGLRRRDGREGPSLGVPVTIMAVAVITTLLSLFVVTWDRPLTSLPATSGPGTAATTPIALVDVTLADAGGDRVRLGDLLPTVILLAEGCNCPGLIAAIAAAAPPPVTIVPIGRTAPCQVGTAPNVRCLADPASTVTSRYQAPLGSGPPPQASPASPGPAATVPAVLIDSTGVATGPTTVRSPDDLSAGFAKLVGG